VDQVFAAEVEHAPHDLRLALISALAERRAETAIDPLSELVLHDDPETREAAAAALGRIGTPGATEALTEALGADTVGAHEPLIEALPVCAQHLVRGQHTTAARSVVTLLRDLDLAVPQQAALLNLDVAVNGRDALPRVLDALHSDTELRGLAVAAARALPAGSEVDLALARLLESPAPEARVVVVRLLEDRGATSAVGVLADTAGSDPDTTVRATALLALGSLGDLSCLELLIRCAQEQEPGIAAAAAEALARVGGEGVDSALIGKLRTGESVPELNAVAQAVVARGLAQAVEVLIERARADDPDLAETCARGLVDLATEQDLPAVVALHAELKDGGVIRQVERALLRIVGASHDRERVAAVLGQALETGPTTARPALVQALARVGTDAAFKGVMAQRQAESEDVRKAVIQALAESQRVDAVPALEASAREDASLVNRILALRAALDLSLARSDLTADDMVTRLGGFMELAERVEEQRMILGLLPRYPTDTAIAMAESLQQDADLADAAARAVEAIRQARLSKSFDFQPRNAPLAQGFIEVTVDTDFTPDRGFGWLSRPQDARDRQTGDELRRDFLFSPRPCTFRVSVAPGLYEVLVWIGDMTLSHDNVAVYAEGAKVLSGLTDSAGQVLEERFEVSVNDGALEIEFRDEGGTDANACIAGLRVRRLDDVGN
jgi:HEAT repeat protein